MGRALVCGIGINDLSGKVSVYLNGKQIHCKAYNRWKAILQRCTSKNFKNKNYIILYSE